jgi:nuclear cap-binding protein subunit 1
LRDTFALTALTESSIVEQPLKIPFIAAVVFYGNQAKIEIASEAIKLVGDRLQETFNAGQWKEFKLFMRFFACLQPLFEEDGIFALLGQLFDTVVDLQSANENDVGQLPAFRNFC